MPIPETVSTAEFWVAQDGAADTEKRFIRQGTLKEVTIESDTNDQLEETFEGTYSSRGRGRTTITFEHLIPLAGKRTDFVKWGMKDHAGVKVVCQIADKRRTYVGIIKTDRENFGIGKAAADSVRIECGEPDFENI